MVESAFMFVSPTPMQYCNKISFRDIGLILYNDLKNCWTDLMSIANRGIMLMSGYEGQKSSETTCEYNKWFVLDSYLDAFHTHSDASITRGCDHETRVLWSYKCRAIS